MRVTLNDKIKKKRITGQVPFMGIWVVFAGCVFLAGCGSPPRSIETHIGALVLEFDRTHSNEDGLNPFGSGPLYSEFARIYEEEISNQPVDTRVRYFWAAMWHFEFDGGLMDGFQEMVVQDCPNEFLERLNRYVEIEGKRGNESARLRFTKKVLYGIEQLLKLKVENGLEAAPTL